jgi:hypothetical protein
MEAYEKIVNHRIYPHDFFPKQLTCHEANTSSEDITHIASLG